MDQEADKVAEEIIRWSQKLSGTMDVQFGCVGIDHYRVNGALNITDVNTLSEYLNSNEHYGYHGTYRTQHFGENMVTPPSDYETLKEKAREYNNAGGEYDIVITIYYPDGSVVSQQKYENVKFVG
ncbi:MAG: hypothetical protein IKJ49_04070 [Bacteroidaceae bacterium]|nr:hypothetical protein [Bacteroidaceae bacterium]